MAKTKTLSFLIFTIIVVLQLNFFSSAQAAVKGGYWYYKSGLDSSNIDSSYYTHLFCAFAGIDPKTYKITIPNTAIFSTFTKNVQKKNPSVKTLLSIGGGNATITGFFSAMAKQSSTRKSFIDSSIQVARANNFHGLDLDWEYPSSDTDKTNLGLLLNEWRTAIAQESRTSGKPKLLLSAAVAGSDQISPLKNYPGQAISKNLDWINVMVYDLFTPSGYKTKTQPPAPLNNTKGQFSGSQGILSWINQVGVPKNKLAIGLPFYGYAWKLKNPSSDHGIFAAANGADVSVDGSIVYGDIIKKYINKGAHHVYNSTFVTDYCFSGSTWIGYDDTKSVSAKVSYAKRNGLIGYFAWHVAGDNNWTLSKTASNAWGSSS